MYDIQKLLTANCVIVGGKVYNDKGHNICGVLNQHDKPCKRIGKCPFHGIHRPVTPHNSINGEVDDKGTVATPNSPRGGSATSPASAVAINSGTSGVGGVGGGGGSGGGSSDIEPRVPPKMQYKHGWTKEEHFLFLGGLAQHGRGSWKQIASVVQTRSPTQVQSHAQKYFQRQKQNHKNKRSIHDLNLDSPEMLEVAKKFRMGHQRSSYESIKFGDSSSVRVNPLHHHASSSVMKSEDIGFGGGRDGEFRGGGMADAAFARFGNVLNNPNVVSNYGSGQLSSAATPMGSSLSTQVNMQHSLTTGGGTRTYHTSSNATGGQPDILGSFNHEPLEQVHPRRAAPGFMRQPVKAEQHAQSGITGGNRNLTFSQSVQQQQQQYQQQQQQQQSFLHNSVVGGNQFNRRDISDLYPQFGGQMTGGGNNNTGFSHQQQKGNNGSSDHSQLTGWCDPPMRLQTTRRDQNSVGQSNQHKMNNLGLQPSQLGSSLHQVNSMNVPDNIASAPVVPNEAMTVGHNQSNSLQGNLFVGTDQVDVEPHMYGVGGGTAQNVTHFNNAMNAFPGSTGLSLGHDNMRGQPPFSTNPISRNG